MDPIFLYIDESGDLGERGSKFFVITAVWIDRPELFDRIIKNLRRHKFRKELRNAQEIKGNKSSEQLKLYFLDKFSTIENEHGQSIVLEKKRLFSKYLKSDKHKLYNYVCGVLASTMNLNSHNVIVRIDRSKGKQALRDDFDQYIRTKFTEAQWNCVVEIYHSWSQSWSGLQFADLVSWAVFQKFEHELDFYYRIIEKKVNINHMWE